MTHFCRVLDFLAEPMNGTFLKIIRFLAEPMNGTFLQIIRFFGGANEWHIFADY